MRTILLRKELTPGAPINDKRELLIEEMSKQLRWHVYETLTACYCDPDSAEIEAEEYDEMCSEQFDEMMRVTVLAAYLGGYCEPDWIEILAQRREQRMNLWEKLLEAMPPAPETPIHLGLCILAQSDRQPYTGNNLYADAIGYLIAGDRTSGNDPSIRELIKRAFHSTQGDATA